MSINNNTKFGINSLEKNMSNQNSAFGFSSLEQNVDGFQNTSVGSESLENNKKGVNNTSIGFRALKNVKSNNNSSFGAFSGRSIQNGTQNVTLGFKADVQDKNDDNSIVIGSGALGHGSNSIVMGNSNINKIDPGSNNKVNLGSSNYKFKNLYLSNSVNTNSINISGSKSVTIDTLINETTLNTKKGSIIFNYPEQNNQTAFKVNNTNISADSFIIICGGYIKQRASFISPIGTVNIVESFAQPFTKCYDGYFEIGNNFTEWYGNTSTIKFIVIN